MKHAFITVILVMTALLQGIQGYAQFNPYALTPREAKEQSIAKGGQLVRAYDKVFLDGYNLKKDEIKSVMTPENYSTWSKGKGMYDVGTALSMAGLVGVIVGVAGIASNYITRPDDDRLFNGSAIVGAAGFGLIAVAIPLEIGGLKKMKNAVNSQNAGGDSHAYFGFAPSGVGLTVRF